MRSPPLLLLSALAVACGAAGIDDAPDGDGDRTATTNEPTAPVESALGAVVADLRADTNRDGTIRFDDPDDDDGEDTWTSAHGAVFLANIDDDQEVCPMNVDDVELPRCHDAADDVVNGEDDAADLARLKTRPWPTAPAGTEATITFTADRAVRLFKVNGSGFTAIASGHKLTVGEIASGVELAIEARDIVRDQRVWDGFTDVTLTVSSEGRTATDRVRLRVSPVMTFHHLLAPVATWVSEYGSRGNAAMRRDLASAAAAAGVPAPRSIGVQDPWMQDLFETGYMSMPAPGGGQHAIRVAIRSANVYQPWDPRNPLREGGRIAFLMRGKDSAAVQQFDRRHPAGSDTLNSFGNHETIPPYTHAGRSYPLGRVLRGRTSAFDTDQSFEAMVQAQQVQPPVYLDTSWLLVAHVDETVSFVAAPTQRGWALLANDATLAANMLIAESNAGRGGGRMFVGKYWDEGIPAQTTVDDVLSDPDVMGSSAEAAVEVASQLAVLKAETGVTDAEIVKVPFLHMAVDGQSVAYQPGMVNGLYLTRQDFVAPAPHGPVVDGQDVFARAMIDALAPLGVTARFAEDWDDYHRNLGEVHCGTNTTRAIPETRWWESGR